MLEAVFREQPPRLLRNPWLTFAIVCGAVASLTLIAQIIYSHGYRLGADFEVFWKAAREPVEGVYGPDPFRPFVYPPTTLLVLQPLAFVPFWPAFMAWSIAGLVAYFVAARSPWLLLLSPVVVQCIVFGQTALLLGALVISAARTPPLARGALIGIVFSIKPQLVVLAPLVFAFRRDWKGVVGFAAGSSASVILSLALYGAGVWIDWIDALPAFRQTLNDQRLWGVVVTPFSYALQLGINPWPVFAVCLILAVAAAAYAKKADPIEIICLTSLFATPYAGGSDLAALLPFAFRRLVDLREPLKLWVAFIYAAAFTPIAVIIGLYRVCWDRQRSPRR